MSSLVGSHLVSDSTVSNKKQTRCAVMETLCLSNGRAAILWPILVFWSYGSWMEETETLLSLFNFLRNFSFTNSHVVPKYDIYSWPGGLYLPRLIGVFPILVLLTCASQGWVNRVPHWGLAHVLHSSTDYGVDCNVTRPPMGHQTIPLGVKFLLLTSQKRCLIGNGGSTETSWEIPIPVTGLLPHRPPWKLHVAMCL